MMNCGFRTSRTLSCPIFINPLIGGLSGVKRAVDLATAKHRADFGYNSLSWYGLLLFSNRRSIPIAQEIATHFDALKQEHDIGALKIKISGCINACGHHHVGHIGILGLDRAGVESYQITLGGDGSETAAIGERVGPGFGADEILDAVSRIIGVYMDGRLGADEVFIAFYRRVGIAPFKAALYPETVH